jgi:hypothetical protein
LNLSKSGSLEGFSFYDSFLSVFNMLRFDTQNSTSPGLSDLFIIVESGSEVFGIEVEFGFVFFSDVSEGNADGGFLTD